MGPCTGSGLRGTASAAAIRSTPAASTPSPSPARGRPATSPAPDPKASMFDFLVNGMMMPILEFFHRLSGNYGFAILMLTRKS